MSKSKVEPLIALVLGGLQIIVPLLGCHGAPDLVSRSVAPLIVELDKNDEECRPCNDSQEHLVARSIVRRIFSAVNLGLPSIQGRKRETCKTQMILTLDEIILPACTVML